MTNSNTLMRQIGRKVAALPIAGPALRSLYRGAGYPGSFHSSSSYWEKRYEIGSNSGPGSYGRLALFKAGVLNHFVRDHGVRSVIEFGCGDGAQLRLATYPDYTGIDVSPSATTLCRRLFAGDAHKRFLELANPQSETAQGELGLSLDVIYHLVEDEVYHAYMARLARAATRFIGIYSSNVELPGHVPHIRHRRFTDWFTRHAPDWVFYQHVPNAYPYDVNDPAETSWADFHFFARRADQEISPISCDKADS